MVQRRLQASINAQHSTRQATFVACRCASSAHHPAHIPGRIDRHLLIVDFSVLPLVGGRDDEGTCELRFLEQTSANIDEDVLLDAVLNVLHADVDVVGSLRLSPKQMSVKCDTDSRYDNTAYASANKSITGHHVCTEWVMAHTSGANFENCMEMHTYTNAHMHTRIHIIHVRRPT